MAKQSSLFKTIATIIATSAITLSVAVGAVVSKALEKQNPNSQNQSGQNGQGQTLKSIDKVEKTNSYGLIDEYTIYYTDGTTSIFIVTNGSDGQPGAQGFPGRDGVTPTITIENGKWVINGQVTELDAVGPQGPQGPQGPAGQDGLTPYIGPNGHWWIGETDTGVQARGMDGEDGYIPLIGENGNWWIGGTDTGVPAQGQAGRGISSIEKTDSQGLVDVYTIYYTDGTTSTFLVTNGADGAQGQGIPGQGGTMPVITVEDGKWVIDGVKTEYDAVGPQGPQGPMGVSVYTGDGVPAADLGRDGDSYINLLNWDYYVMDNGAWVKVGNIAGQAGANGSSVSAGNGDPTTGNVPGNPGDTYIDLSTGDVYHMGDNGEWGNPDANSNFAMPHIGANGNWWIGETDTGVPAQGQDGQQGASIYTGSGNPSGDPDNGVPAVAGNAGDTYIDLSTGDVYHMDENGDWGSPDANSNFAIPHIGTNGHWYIGEEDTGVNATGPQGPAGASVSVNHGDPTTNNVEGKQGDTYIDLDTGYYYTYDETNGWVKSGEGAAATSVLTGNGEPAASTGKDGDSYINLANWDFYVKEAGEWNLAGNIKGADGASGAAGAQGASVSVGHGDPTTGNVQGNVGDTYIDLNTGNYYTMGDEGWGEPAGGGAIGSSLRYGTTAPDNSLGNDGDSYINTQTWDYYAKENGVWVLQGNFAGQAGTNGVSISSVEKTNTEGLVDTYTITYSDNTNENPHTQTFTVTNGADGNKIIVGTGEPTDETLANVGDNYIDVSTWKLYVKADDSWTDKGSFKGDAGADGVSIVSVEFKESNALIDVYEITYSDSTNENPHVDTFTVTNGKDGTSVRTGHRDPRPVVDDPVTPEDETLAAVQGIEGDSFIDLDTWNFFVLQDDGEGNLVWNPEGNLHYSPNRYTVTFDSNGGSAVDSYDEALEGFTITNPTAPTQDGYFFQGWYTEEGTRWDFSKDVITKDTTLTARWGQFIVEDGLIKDCSITSGDIVIPEFYDNQLVIGIADEAFKDKTGITSFTLPRTVKSIGNSAFEGCTGLTSVVIPSNVKSIGTDAFKDCSNVAYVYIEEGAANPGISTLRSLPQTNGLESIGAGAFSGCSSLKGIVLPSTIKSIGKGAFEDCDSLESYTAPFIGSSVEASVSWAYCYGAGEPTTTNPSNNVYLDTESGYIWVKANGEWNKSEMAVPLNMVVNGAPTGSANNGDVVMDIETGNLYGYQNDTWISYMNLLDNPQMANVLSNYVTNATYLSFVFGGSSYDDNSSALPSSLKTVTITGDYAIDTNAMNGCDDIETIIISGNPSSIGFGAFAECDDLKSIALPYIGPDSGYIAPLTYSYGNGEPNTVNPTATTYFDLATKHYWQFTNGQWLDLTEDKNDETLNILASDAVVIGTEFPSSDRFFNYETGEIYVYYGGSWLGVGSILNYANPAPESNYYLGYIFGAGDKENQSSRIPSYLNTIILTGANGDNKDCIPSYAFYGCDAENIVLPNNVREISDYAFGRTEMTSFVVPDSVEYIGKGVFKDTYIKEITLPFIGKSRDSLSIADTSFEDYLFDGGCDVETVILTGANGVNRDIIPDYAFASVTDLKNVILCEGITKIGVEAFHFCTNLERIDLPSTLKVLGQACFYQTKIRNLSLPLGLTTIERAALADTKLTSLVIPGSVTTIGQRAFYDNDYLKSIVFQDGNAKTFGNDLFLLCPSLEYVYLGYGITKVENSMFADVKSLKNVGLAESITVIEDLAFKGCYSLKAINLPANLESIGIQAFYHCTGLEIFNMPDRVSSLGYMAFEGCISLKNIKLSESLTSIDVQTFEDCMSLVTIVMPSNLEELGTRAFFGCTSLKYAVLNDGLQTINEFAFTGCDSLESIIIPDSVTNINRGAFSTGLTRKGNFYDTYSPERTEHAIVKVTGTYGLPNDGEVGDVFIFTDDAHYGEIYVRTSAGGHWTLRGTIVGYEIVYDYINPASVEAGKLYINAESGDYFVDFTSSLTSITVPMIGGSAGFIGEYIYSGALADGEKPANDIGNDNDLYIDTASSSIYRKINSEWQGQFTLTLENGELGTMDAGTDEPNPNDDAGYDYYINTDTGEFWFKNGNGKWGYSMGNIYEMFYSFGYFFVSAGSQQKGAYLNDLVPDSLKVVNIKNVEFIAPSAFAGCSNVETVVFPDTLEYIYADAFKNCSSLLSLELPDSLISVEPGAFAGCNSIKALKTSFFQTQATQSFHFVPDDASFDSTFANAYIGDYIIRYDLSAVLKTSTTDYVDVELLDILNVPKYQRPEDPYINGYWEYGTIYTNTATNKTYIRLSDGYSVISDDVFNPTRGSGHPSTAVPDAPKYSYYFDETSERLWWKNYFGNWQAVEYFKDLDSSDDVLLFCDWNGNFTETDMFGFQTHDGGGYVLAEDGQFYYSSSVYWLEFDSIQLMTEDLVFDKYTPTNVLYFSPFTGGFCNPLSSELICRLEFPSSECLFGIFGSTPDAMPATLETVVLSESFVAVPDAWFAGCKNVKTLILPNTLKDIGDEAFAGMFNITSLVLPDSLENVGLDAFAYCTSLKYVTLPDADTFTAIGDGMFMGCISLSYMPMTNYITSIGREAFRGCTSLVNVVVPSQIENIGMGAFADCNNIESIVIPFVGGSLTDNTKLEYIFGDEYDYYEDDYMPQSLKTVILTGGNGTDRDTIPSNAFAYCTYLEHIEIPDTIKLMEWAVFYGCTSLEYFRVPGSVIEMQGSVFKECTNLKTIIIEEGVEIIGNYAFEKCTSLTSITIPNSAKQLGESMLAGTTNLRYFTTPFLGSSYDTTGTLHYFFGYNSDLTNPSELTVYVTIGNGYSSKTIGQSAFSSCGNYLTTLNVILSDNITYIANGAFAGCSYLKSLALPRYLESVGSSAFYNCSSLKYIDVPDGVTYFGDSVFYGCTSLVAAKISLGITEIPRYTFLDCTSLQTVTFHNGITRINKSAFDGCISLTALDLPDSLTEIGESAFAGCSSIKYVHFSNRLQTIGKYAFRGCSQLSSIVVPDSVTSIGAAAFFGCNFTSMTLPFVGLSRAGSEKLSNLFLDYSQGQMPDNLETLIFTGGNGNENMYLEGIGTIPSLKNIIYPNNGKIKYVGGLKGCTGLESIYLPDSIKNIRESAFKDCTNLKYVYNSDLVESIGDYAFQGCTSLQSISLKNAETISRGAFDSDSALVYIAFGEPDSFFVGQGAFQSCSSLKAIYLPANARYNYQLFNGCTSLEILGISSVGLGGTGTLSQMIASMFSVVDYEDANINLYSALKTVEVRRGNTDEYIIPERAFEKATHIETIILADNITAIGRYAFKGCESLKNLNMPASLKTIGDYAFDGCWLIESYNLPETVTSIGYAAFRGKAIEEWIEIAEAVGIHAHGEGIPNVDSIAPSDADGVDGDIYVSENRIEGGSSTFRAIFFEKQNGHWVECFTCIQITSDAPDAQPRYEKYSYVYSETTHKVFRISYESNLKALVLPFVGGSKTDETKQSLAYIFGGGRYNSLAWNDFLIPASLKTVVIRSANSDGAIPVSSFAQAQNIETIALPNDAIAYGDFAFAYCSNLKNVNYADSLETIGDYAFANCTMLGAVNLANKVKTIGNYAFMNVGLGLERSEIRYGHGDPILTPVAQEGDKYIDVDSGKIFTLQSNNWVLTGNATVGHGVPSSVAEGSYYFDLDSGLLYHSGDTRFTSIVIPNSVDQIGFGAFEGCTSLQSMTLPFIGSCLNDGDAYSHGDTLYFAYIFGADRWNETLSSYDSKVPSALKSVTFTSLNVISAGPGMSYSTVCNYAFAECSSLENIYITNNCALIGDYAFYGCSSLKLVVVPNDCISVGEYAFANCLSLKYVYLPDELTPPSFYPEVEINFGDCVFANCASLEALVFPTETNVLGHNALIGCTSLKTLSLPSTYIDLEELNGNGGDPATEQNNDPDPSNPDDYDYNYWLNNITGDFFVNYKGTWFKLYTNTHRGEVKSGYGAPSSSGNLDDIYFNNGGSVKEVYVHDGNNWQLSFTMRFSYLPYYFDDDADLVPQSLKTVVVTAADGATPVTYAHMFKGCKYIENIILPDNVTIIGNYAFDGCASLKAFAFGENIETIGESAFANCKNLETVVLPTNMTSIGDYAFQNCTGLTSFTVPDAVTSIGFGAFKGCNNLTSITIPFVGDNPLSTKGTCAHGEGAPTNDIESTVYLDTVGKKLYQKTSGVWSCISDGDPQLESDLADSIYGTTLPDDPASAGAMFINYETLDAYIPAGNEWLLVVNFAEYLGLELPSNSFFGYIFGAGSYKNQSSYIPYSLSRIILTNANGVDRDTIPNHAFYGLSEIDHIILPQNYHVIGTQAFAKCSFTSFTLPDSVTSIGLGAFAGCNGLETFIFSLANGDPTGGGLAYLFVTNPANESMYDTLTSMKKIIITGGTSIPDRMFSGLAYVERIVIPDSVQTIGNYAFGNCNSLLEVKLPENITSIGESAFEGCSSLKRINIPENVTAIEDKVFYECTSLEWVDAAYGCSFTSIGEYAFYRCTSLKNASLLNAKNTGTLTIGQYAFYRCTSLSGDYIIRGITEIGASAFEYSGIGGITLVAHDDDAIIIGIDAFKNCFGLERFITDKPNGTITIGHYAFQNCISLEDVMISNNATIQARAFFNCSCIRRVFFGGSSFSEWETFRNNRLQDSGNDALCNAVEAGTYTWDKAILYCYSANEPVNLQTTDNGKYWRLEISDYYYSTRIWYKD